MTERRLPPALEEKAYGQTDGRGELYARVIETADVGDWLYGKKVYGPGNVLLDESEPGLVRRVLDSLPDGYLHPDEVRDALSAELGIEDA